MHYELGFIGAGNMGEAIARAAIEHRVLDAGAIIACDPSPQRCEVFTGLGVVWAADNVEVIRSAQQVLLAVKPQTLPKVAGELGTYLTADQIVISIMAGITSAKLAAAMAAGAKSGSGAAAIPGAARIVRVMPNTPLMVGQGMAGIALGAGARPGDEALALKLFGSAGKAVLVGEDQIDAITAVSGSGPAYVFYLAEAMHRAAVELGLGADADELVRQTILGAATLLSQSPDSPSDLRRKVTSPGGTTEAAIKHMDGNKTTEVIVNAVKAAHQRSRELGAQ
jgi:pyrroline-5-carboxylate reductase